CTDQYGPTFLGQLHDLFDHGVELFAGRLVYKIIVILANNGTVSRNNNDVEFVDVPEFTSLSLRGTSHARELVVHSEIILQGDRGVRLRRVLNLHIFLGFDRLVKTIGIPPSLEHTARLLINDLNLPIDDDVFGVAFVERIGPQQLVNGVNTGRLYLVVADEFLLLLKSFLVGEFGIVFNST